MPRHTLQGCQDSRTFRAVTVRLTRPPFPSQAGQGGRDGCGVALGKLDTEPGYQVRDEGEQGGWTDGAVRALRQRGDGG